MQEKLGCIIGKDYPMAMVDHAKERLITLQLYKDVARMNSGVHGTGTSMISFN